MRKRFWFDIALLCLPILIVGGTYLFIKSASRETPAKPVSIARWEYGNADLNDFSVYLTLEWNRSWFEKRKPIKLVSDSWILDADGKVVAKQNGYGFGPEGPANHFKFYPGNIATSHIPKPWKEPLTFQGVMVINSKPLKVNYILPASIKGPVVPRTSPLPMLNIERLNRPNTGGW